MLSWDSDAEGRLVALDRDVAAVSRRQFLRGGAVAMGGVAGVGLLDPSSVFARANPAPRPIPGGFDKSFMPVPKHPLIHVLSPGIGSEMSTITNFSGVVAGSETRGQAHGSDGTTYDFDTDMRFMHGTYVGFNKRPHHATFGFISIDLYDTGAVGDPNHQRHDFEHGIARSGLCWTLPIPASAIHFDTATGQARFQLANVAVRDYFNILNAIAKSPSPKPLPSHVSFDVRWHGQGQHRKIRDKKFGFEGDYVTGRTTVSFRASQENGGVIYRSDPTAQYNPTVKQGGSGSPAVGLERNGVFFH